MLSPDDLTHATSIVVPQVDPDKTVYLAIIDMDDRYDLEVELNEGAIGTTLQLDTHEVAEARAEADRFQAVLIAAGLTVIQSRDAWEQAIDARFERDGL